MPARATSKAAYLDVTSDGTSAAQRRRLFQKLEQYPGLTRKELSECMGMPINVVCPRINELLAAGFVREDGCRRDPLTKKSANLLYVNPEKTIDPATEAAA